jgi:branched-chain amino acid transport system permease protein
VSYLLGVVGMFAVYLTCGLGCVLLLRHLRIVSVAHGAVFGLAAFVYANVALGSPGPRWAGLAALATGTIAGACLTFASERVAGEDFALLTFAVQVMFVSLATLARAVTGGALGLSGVPAIVSQDANPSGFALSAAVLAVVGAVVTIISLRRRFVLATAVVATSSELAGTLGIPVAAVRLQVGALYGVLIGAGAVLFCGYVSHVATTSFDVDMSVTILAIGLMGLSRPVLGAAVGAVLFVGVPEVARFAGAGIRNADYLRVMLAGGATAVVAVLVARSSRGATSPFS